MESVIPSGNRSVRATYATSGGRTTDSSFIAEIQHTSWVVKTVVQLVLACFVFIGKKKMAPTQQHFAKNKGSTFLFDTYPTLPLKISAPKYHYWRSLVRNSLPKVGGPRRGRNFESYEFRYLVVVFYRFFASDCYFSFLSCQNGAVRFTRCVATKHAADRRSVSAPNCGGVWNRFLRFCSWWTWCGEEHCRLRLWTWMVPVRTLKLNAHCLTVHYANNCMPRGVDKRPVQILTKNIQAGKNTNAMVCTKRRTLSKSETDDRNIMSKHGSRIPQGPTKTNFSFASGCVMAKDMKSWIYSLYRPNRHQATSMNTCTCTEGIRQKLTKKGLK